MGVAGLATTIAGLVGIGIGLLMYQTVSVDASQFDARWRQVLLSYVVSGVVLALVFAMLASMMFSSIDARVIIALGLSEVLSFPIVGAAAFAFAAHERMGWAAALPACAAMVRMVMAAVYFALAADPSIQRYVEVHAISSILTSVFALLAVRVLLRPGPGKVALSAADIKAGAGYSGIWFTGNALASWDKALALRFGGSEVAGLYAIAYRVAAVLAVPVDSLVMAAMPRLFRQGSGEIQHPRLVALLCGLIAAYGSVIGLALFAFAHYLPVLLGEDFAPAVHALSWLGLFVPLYGLRQLGGQLMLARNQKRMRFLIEICGLMLMSALSFLLIPRMGLEGAVVSILAIESGLMAVIWLVLRKNVHTHSGIA